MIVPQFWAEGRLRRRVGNRQFTMRRFGWSDESQAAAQAHADARAAEALEKALAGKAIARRELKVPYNGADGLPIREEIVSKRGECVVTRNSYGALCLNTPNVFFADIDFEPRFNQLGAGCQAAFLVIVGVIAAISLGPNWRGAIAAAVAAIVLLTWALRFAAGALRRRQGMEEEIATARVRRFIEAHPEWKVRLYRTPAGLRVLALHKTFDPADPETEAAFRELDVDPVYAQMCELQRCFRARVSPKPWRIGIEQHLRPRPGVWPIAPERMALRSEWIRAYEGQSRGYASCALIETLGSGATHPEAQFVQLFHDELSQACSQLPIA